MSDDYLINEKDVKQIGYNKRDICEYISYDISQKVMNDFSEGEKTKDEIITIYNNIAKCKCCDRHMSGRPINCCKGAKNTESLVFGGPNKVNLCLSGIICNCHCRQLMRFIVYSL